MDEKVRHFALKVQQLVEKGWCIENASTLKLKCIELFTKGLPKNLSRFANKSQVKHTSTVLEPSTPFHTLVKLIDANNLTNQLQTQTLDSSKQEKLMFTQSRDPNNKSKPAFKKFLLQP